MASTILPVVRLMFACDEAAFSPAEGDKCRILQPWSTVELPEGKVFPFRAVEVHVYVQLSDGIGTVDLAVGFRQLTDHKGRRTIGQSAVQTIEFDPKRRLYPIERIFEMKNVPFREPGLYEFFVTSETDGLKDELTGETALLRVLGPGGV